jgi:hypothetical protein
MGKEKQSVNLPGPRLIQKFLIIASPCQHWARLNILSSTKLWTSFQILKFQGWSNTIVVESNLWTLHQFWSPVFLEISWDVFFIFRLVHCWLDCLLGVSWLEWSWMIGPAARHGSPWHFGISIKTTPFRSLHLSYHPSRQTAPRRTAAAYCALRGFDPRLHTMFKPQKDDISESSSPVVRGINELS